MNHIPISGISSGIYNQLNNQVIDPYINVSASTWTCSGNWLHHALENTIANDSDIMKIFNSLEKELKKIEKTPKFKNEKKRIKNKINLVNL